jgi:hypothetical protein
MTEYLTLNLPISIDFMEKELIEKNQFGTKSQITKHSLSPHAVVSKTGSLLFYDCKIRP